MNIYTNVGIGCFLKGEHGGLIWNSIGIFERKFNVHFFLSVTQQPAAISDATEAEPGAEGPDSPESLCGRFPRAPQPIREEDTGCGWEKHVIG